MVVLKFIAVIIVSYFFGNVHFARVLSRAKHDDITKHGSGNPGTMNMLRTHGLIFALTTLILDALKGAIPALLAYYIFGGFATGSKVLAVNAMSVAGLFAVLGHVYPVIYKFKGGKGVATAFGFFTVVNPMLSLVLFIVGVITFAIFKIGSVASLTYISTFAIWQVVSNLNRHSAFSLVIIVLVAVLIFAVHSSNIKKLCKLKENKIDMNQVLKKDAELIKSAKNTIITKKDKKN